MVLWHAKKVESTAKHFWSSKDSTCVRYVWIQRESMRSTDNPGSGLLHRRSQWREIQLLSAAPQFPPVHYNLDFLRWLKQANCKPFCFSFKALFVLLECGYLYSSQSFCKQNRFLTGELVICLWTFDQWRKLEVKFPLLVEQQTATHESLRWFLISLRQAWNKQVYRLRRLSLRLKVFMKQYFILILLCHPRLNIL